MKVLILSAIFWSIAIQAGSSVSTRQHDKKVVCYYGSWAHYQEEPGRFDVTWVDTDLCTHGLYAYADIDTNSWFLMPTDPWYDLGPSDCGPGECNFDSYRRFTALASETFVPMLSVGGWDQGPEKLSQLAKDPLKRRAFIDSSVDFLMLYGFQGLDIDWEFPGLAEGGENDKQNLNLLVEETKAAFDLHGLILSLVLSPEYEEVDIGYDVPFLSQHCEFLTVIAYDYHSFYAGHEYAAHEAPMYRIRQEENINHPGYGLNVYDGIRNLIQKGADPAMLLLGIPAFGNGFILADPLNNGLYCSAVGPINAGPIDHQTGVWSYQEILKVKQDSDLSYLPGATPLAWSTVVDDCQRVPYMYNGQYWIGYEDVKSVGLKTKLANELGLGGVMVWSMDKDDFNGAFSDAAYPLLTEINNQLILGDTFDPTLETCGQNSAPVCDITQ